MGKKTLPQGAVWLTHPADSREGRDWLLFLFDYAGRMATFWAIQVLTRIGDDQVDELAELVATDRPAAFLWVEERFPGAGAAVAALIAEEGLDLRREVRFTGPDGKETR